jgi:cytochrome c556
VNPWTGRARSASAPQARGLDRDDKEISMKTRTAWSAVMAGVVSLTFVAGGVHAGSEPEDIIKYRRNVMKANGAHMAAAGAILQGKVGEYRKHLGEHVRAIQEINRDVAALFPKGSDFGETEALDGVWQKRAEFEKRAKDANQKAAALGKALAAGDSKAQLAAFKELADSCKACHKDFRKEEK